MSTNISSVVKDNLCTGCGVCVAACPSKAINVISIKGRFQPTVEHDKCISKKGCQMCLNVCPGHEVQFHSLAKNSLTVPHVQQDYYIGSYLQCFTGHSINTDIRYRSASGGMVSQFLIFLLEQGYINGAIIASFDPSNSLLVKTSIATTKEEILQGKSSKYGPVSMHEAVTDLKKVDGRYVVVGLPCHIHGFRKLSETFPKIRKKIFGFFSLFCSESRTFHLTEYVFKERRIDINNLQYFAYRDEGCLGKMVVVDKKDDKYLEPFQSYYHPLRSFFIPRRCITCVDHYGELGDVSFGDIHYGKYKEDKIGVNSVVVRNQLFLKLLKDAADSGQIILEDLDAETLNKSQRMRKHKKHRAATILKIERFLGRPVATYDLNLTDPTPVKSIMSYYITILQMFIGSRKWLWFLIKPLKRKPHITG
jgi:coenzyme F420 hydrogenase subunit beta